MESSESEFRDRVLASLTSESSSEVAWAVTQMFVPNARDLVDSFLEFLAILRVKRSTRTPELVSTTLQALARELASPVVSDEVRVNQLIPAVLLFTTDDISGAWRRVLRSECQALSRRSYRDKCFQLAGRVLADETPFSIENGATIVQGLCESHSEIPKYLVRTLLARPDVLSRCLLPVLCSIRDSCEEDYFLTVLEAVMRSGIPDFCQLDAFLQLVGLPEVAKRGIGAMVAREWRTPAVVAALLKNHFRAISQKIVSEKQLRLAVIELPAIDVLVTSFPGVLAGYISDCVTGFPEADAMQILRLSIESGSPDLLTIASECLRCHHSAEFCAIAVPVLVQLAARAAPDRWVSAFDRVISVVPLEAAETLTNRLVALTKSELTDGHLITADSDVDLRPIRISGHRQVDAFLTALAKSPCEDAVRRAAIPLVSTALRIHGRAVASGVAAVLATLMDRPGIVVNFLIGLAEQNCTMKQIFLRLSLALIDVMDRRRFAADIAPVIVRLADGKIDIVRCAAIRILPSLARLGELCLENRLYIRIMDAYVQAQRSMAPGPRDAAESIADQFRLFEKIVPRRTENTSSNATVPMKPAVALMPRKRRSLIIKPRKSGGGAGTLVRLG